MHPAETSPAQCDAPDMLYSLFLSEDGLGILRATEDTTISAGSVYRQLAIISWRKERDSNPRWVAPHRFSRPAP